MFNIDECLFGLSPFSVVHIRYHFVSSACSWWYTSHVPQEQTGRGAALAGLVGREWSWVGVEVEPGLDGIHIVQLGIHCHLPADNGREVVIGPS